MARLRTDNDETLVKLSMFLDGLADERNRASKEFRGPETNKGNEVPGDAKKDKRMIRCEQEDKVYYIPPEIFAKVVLGTESHGKKYVRYKTGGELYDMSEHRFREIALQADACRKVDQTVLVNLEVFERYLESCTV